MKNKLTDSLYDAFMSIMPITFFIFLLSFVITLPIDMIIAFLLSSLLVIFGMALFTLGADMSMVVIGQNIGDLLVNKGKKSLILIVSLIIGVVITLSEPDLNVFAKEITSIPNTLIVVVVSIGIGIFLMLGVLRILNKMSFRNVVSVIILLILSLLLFVPKEFISIAFDGGAVTTGPVGLPLILAFGYGITKIRSDTDAQSDSFGLCGFASLGPIMVLLLLGFFFKVDNYFDISVFNNNMPLVSKFFYYFKIGLKDVVISLIPIVCVFIVYLFIRKKKSKPQIVKIMVGFILVLVGLTIFLTGVSTGFMQIGFHIGYAISSSSYKLLLIPLGMIMGYIIINVEPAVKILNKQISDLTEGSISKKMINLCLSIGVCFAIGIALLRIFTGIPLTYIIVPGYLLVLFLMYRTPKMFMTIAFDAGGAASGAMTTSFMLPLCIGACHVLGGNILVDAFGVGSLVGISPLIMVQLLGVIYNHKIRVRNKEILNEEIIDYAWEG